MSQVAESLAHDLFEHAPDPAAHLAPDGLVLCANAAFRAAFRHVLGSRRPPWGRVEPPTFIGGTRRFDAPAPDGRLFEWSERRLLDGSRIATARDVTERARAGEDADRAKTLLFATLTHELRTPLNGILGMTGLIAQSRLEPEARDHLRAVRQSGEHLLDLINEILDYSRLEAGNLALERATFDVEATAQSVAELLSPKAYEKGIEIAVVLGPGAPTHVVGDESRFRQILFNLAGNAVKFTQTGGVAIELSAPAGGRLRLVVRDTGPGVACGAQAAIFEEFAQADASIARRYGGAGLGLAIVRKLATAMGGAVGIESRPGRGAAFWVEAPLPAGAGGEQLPSLAHVHAALVTPSDTLARSLEAMVTGLGGRATRGACADANVVLLDHAANFDRAQIETLDAPVVALVPQEEREAIARYRDAGAAHYVVKPVRRRSLAERLRIATGQEARAPDAPSTDDDRARPPALAGVRVLLAEDHPVNALIARTILARAGALVDVVSDGVEAAAAAHAAPYDLVLLDLRMPRLDGVSAAQRIRAEGGASARAPLIALTADASEADRKRALEAGMDEFLTKPVDPQVLAMVAARFTGAAKASSL